MIRLSPRGLLNEPATATNRFNPPKSSSEITLSEVIGKYNLESNKGKQMYRMHENSNETIRGSLKTMKTTYCNRRIWDTILNIMDGVKPH